MHRAIVHCLTLLGILLAGIFGLSAAFAANATDELASLDVEALLGVEVIPPANRKQRLSHIAGSYTVLTEEDIRRSGAASIPEALRVVPGIEAHKVDTDKWALGTRGFKGTFSNKYLILLDGRPLSTPSLNGVIWSSQQMPIEMVERIEVIRGPWTSLWGADSLNGVINVISKTAGNMRGGLAVTQLTGDALSQMVRHGWKLAGDTDVALFAKGGYDAGDSGSRDRSEEWKYGSLGMTADWSNAFTDHLSLQGSFSLSNVNESLGSAFLGQKGQEKTDYNGFIQFSFDRATGLDAGWQFRSSFTSDHVTLSDLSMTVHRVDAELVRAQEMSGSHLLTWGVGTMYFWDDVEEGDSVTLSPGGYDRFDVNTYIQDRITLIDDRLYLTLGMKLDSFGDKRIIPQPTARLLLVDGDMEYWTAISRAARLPDRLSGGSSFTIEKNGTTYTVTTDDELNVEELISYELGFRHNVSETFSYDFSSYFNAYDSLVGMVFDDTAKTAMFESFLDGTIYGFDASANWKIHPDLVLKPSNSLQILNFPGFSSSGQVGSPPINGYNVESKMQLLWDVAPQWQFDSFLRHTFKSPDDDSDWNQIDLDVRLEYQAHDDLRFEFIVNSLVSEQWAPKKREADPAAELRITWSF